MADNLFSNKMQNLDILRYSNDESYVNYIKHLSVKTAVKTENVQVLLPFKTNAKIKIALVLLKKEITK